MPSFNELFQILFTFTLVTFAWIFFRAPNLTVAWSFVKHIINSSILSIPQDFPLITTALVICFIIIEWISRFGVHPFQKTNQIKYVGIRWSIYYIFILTIILFSGKQQQFIYFQF